MTIYQPNTTTKGMLELLESIKDREIEFKLIIREDGSGIVIRLDKTLIFDFDTLPELIAHYS